jgi:hypothetical protein
MNWKVYGKENSILFFSIFYFSFFVYIFYGSLISFPFFFFFLIFDVINILFFIQIAYFIFCKFYRKFKKIMVRESLQWFFLYGV